MPAPINDKVKAAILADLITGEPVLATAKKYKVARNTVIKIQSDAGLNTVRTPSVREQIWAAVDLYLLEALETMRVHLKAGRDEGWIKSHDTAGLAALHNAVAEKVARMVEAEETAAVGAPAPIDIRRAS